MTIAVDREEARVPVAVMRLEGELDSATYLDVLASARDLVEQGVGYILLDLERVEYMGSSGLFAIHSIAMLLGGKEPPDPEHGWGAIHQADPTEVEAVQRLKLLSPQPQVARVLERSGLTRYFTSYTDRAEALAAF